MSSLLPFKLFCQRKGFSIEGYVKKFPDSNFKEFCNFLVSREIQPPSEEEFLKIKDALKLQENKLSESKDFSQVEVKEDIVKQKPATTTRKRRKIKSKTNNDD